MHSFNTLTDMVLSNKKWLAFIFKRMSVNTKHSANANKAVVIVAPAAFVKLTQ